MEHSDAQLWIAMAPLYAGLLLALVKVLVQHRKRNGGRNGDASIAPSTKWNHEHAKTLAAHGDTLAGHETAIALMQQALAQQILGVRDGQEQTMKRLDVLGGRIHDLNNDMTAVLLKLDLPRSSRRG